MEVLQELKVFYPGVSFDLHTTKTTGDLDLKTSLRHLSKTDFFTKEIDILQTQGKIRIGIHSAKDLPDPLAQGLIVAALTGGKDASDSLVFEQDPLPLGARIGVSCHRREEAVLKFRSDLICVDIRGPIGQRLQLLSENKVQGVVIAEAAIIRLNLKHINRIRLEGETTMHQGKLAITALENDSEMLEMFSCIDIRKLHENLIARY